MAIKNETRILKTNTFEGWRQKDNKISLNLGDVTAFDTLIADKEYSTTASVGNTVFSGTRFEFLNEETIDSTNGYIILKNNPSIPAAYVANAIVSQAGGFTATIVSIIGTVKIKVKNASGTFNSAQKITVGTSDITAANVSRTISEAYPKTVARVFNGATEQTQVEANASGFHVVNHQYDITLTGAPTLPATYNEGATIFQGSNDVVGSATWSGVIYDITATKIRLKSQSGSFSTSTLLRVDGNTGAANQIAAAKISAGDVVDYSYGTLIELHSVAAANDVIKIDANNVVDAINELQDDIGDVAVIDDATGFTATSVVTGITELQGDIGDITGLETTTEANIVSAVNELETAMRGSTSAYTVNTTATDFRAAINEIEGVFDASTYEISAGSNAFNITSGQFTIDSSDVISLDSAAGEWQFKDSGTTIAQFVNSSSDIILQNTVQDKDIKFKGNDNGSDVIALTLDMSDAGAATFINDVNVGVNLEVDGTAGIDGNLRVGSDKFNVTAASGNTQIDGTLNVDGSTQLDGTLNVDGATTLNDTTIDGALDLNGGVDVAGAIVIHGNSSLGDAITDSTTISGSTTVGGTFGVTGNSTLSGTLTVDGVVDIGQLNAKFSNRNNVKLALNELHDELGIASITGTGTAAAGLANITDAVNAIDAEIGTVVSYESGTYGSTTISGVLTSLQAGVIANDTDIAGNDSDISTINTKLGTITAAGMGTTASTVSTAIAELHGEINTSVTNISSNDTDITALQGNGSSTGRLRLDNTGTQTTAGNITFGGSKTIKIASTATLDIDGTLIVGGAGGGSLTYETAFITIAGTANLEGLEVDRSAISGVTLSTTDDAKLQWRESKIATGASNSSHRAWQLQGFTNASTPVTNTTDVVTFYNAKDLLKNQLASSGSSEVYGAWTATTDSEGFNLHLNNSGVTADDYGSTTTVPVLTVDVKGRITSATTANIATNLTIAGDTGTANTIELLSETFTLEGGTNISTAAGTNKVIVNLDSTISITELDAVTLDISGNSDLAGNLVVHGATTLGNAIGDHTSVSGNLAVSGNLTIAGTLTTTTTSDVAITDKNILLGKGSTTSTASDGTGITFGEYGAAATFNYAHSTGRLTSNKNIQATTFYGALSGAATSLETGQTIGMTGDVTWTSAAFNGSGAVTGTSTIGANKVIESHLKASNSATNGQVLSYNSSTQGFTWTTIGAGTTVGFAGNHRAGAVTIADGGSITITESPTGTFTFSSTDNNTTYTAGTALTLNGTTFNHNNFITAGTYGQTGTEDGTYVKSITVNAQGHVTAVSSDDFDDRYVNDVDSVSTNTYNKTVKRDATGNFLAGTITATLSGNALTATALATARTIGGTSFDGTENITVALAGTATTLATARTIGGTSFDGSANIAVALAGTATTLATARTIGGTSFDGSDDIAVDLSATATALATARTIGGESFDGTVNINLPGVNATGNQDTSGNASTATKISTITNSNIVQLLATQTLTNKTLTSPTLITPVLGTPASGTLTNCTFPILDQDTTGNAATASAVTWDNVTNKPSVDNYVSWTAKDHDGTTYAVTSGDTLQFKEGTGIDVNFTGDDQLTITNTLPNIVQTTVTGNAGTADQIYVNDATVSQGYRLIFGEANDGTNGYETLYKETSGHLYYNPLTNVLTSQWFGGSFTGNGSLLGSLSGTAITTGTVAIARGGTGNSTGTAVLVSGAAQSAITSVGTLTGLTLSGGISGTTATFTGDVTAMTSDARLKTFDGKIENALDKVMQLNGYQFHWNDEAKGLVGGDVYSNDSQVGVSAQEVEAIMPEVVKPAAINNDNPGADYKTVQYEKIVPLLIEAIKELKEENNLLRSVVEELKDINS